MRSPFGGRGFEFFGEDPVLVAGLGVAFVRGVQRAGVAAAVKHFVANDAETGRGTYDVRVAEGVLREVYLVPFEACVREGGAWLVMAAYNRVNGVAMTENVGLLRDVLKNEWGFDGVVVSDWHAARRTRETAAATLDLSMPGPGGPWGELLAQAVAGGVVSQGLVDDKVVRLLRLASRVGALDGGNGEAVGGAAGLDGGPGGVDGGPGGVAGLDAGPGGAGGGVPGENARRGGGGGGGAGGVAAQGGGGVVCASA